MELVANRTEKVSLNTVLSDFYEDNGIVQKDIDESMILKWAEDETFDNITDRQLVPRFAWLSVCNYKADLPSDLVIINEIAYRIKPPTDSCGNREYEITQYVQDTHEGCEIEINVICPACHKTECSCNSNDIIVDIGTSFEISHPEMYYSKYAKVGRFGYGKSVHDPNWNILCHTENDWFGVNKHMPGCANLHCRECPHTYRIEPPNLDTSFEDGEVLISYMGRELDENGTIMIPKHRDVFEAILQHITYKYYRREYLMRREASDRAIYQEAKFLRDEARVKARVRLSTPSFAEISKFWSKNKWSKIDNAYSNLLDGCAPVVDLKGKQRNIYKS